MIAHLRPYGFEVGSVHKYGEMFSRVANVTDIVLRSITEPLESVVKTLKAASPSLVIVRGDRWDMWQAAHRLGIPYILDMHDIHSMRVPANEAAKFDERGQVENAAAIVFTSEDHLAYCAAHYRMPPARVVHLRPLAKALDFEPLPKLKGKHIVYAGGLTPNNAASGIYGYRSYGVSIFPALIAAGWKVHVYPCYLAGEATKGAFRKIGCIVHDEVPEDDLPREMSRYSVSLQSYANDGYQTDAFRYTASCRPNKLWSGLAAGIPTVGFQGGNGTALYDGSWGLVAHTLSELPAIAAKASKLRIPDALRRSQVMDSDEPTFRELVALARRQPVKAEPIPRSLSTTPANTRVHPLGVHIPDFEGREWKIGEKVDHATALRMKAAGVIRGERLKA